MNKKDKTIKTLKAISLVLIALLGVLTLANGDISKGDYALIWAWLLFEEIENLL